MNTLKNFTKEYIVFWLRVENYHDYPWLICIIIIYCVSRPILSQYGIWDQVRVDHGKEWVLMLFAQAHTKVVALIFKQLQNR